MNLTSVVTAGVLMGVALLVAALGEFFIAAVKPTWQWSQALLGVFSVGGTIWCFVAPYSTFWARAAAFGFLLILLEIVNIVGSIQAQSVNNAWWLRLDRLTAAGRCRASRWLRAVRHSHPDT